MIKKRLSKALAEAGVASRRGAEKLIFEGRVSVNGDVVLVPQTLVDPEADKIICDGKLIKIEEKVHYILNKPKGYICSNRRTTPRTRLVMDLFASKKRIFTVGRLDRNTLGLLIVTNDGEFANKIIHPSSNIQKEYLAKTDKEITHEHLKKISKGAYVEGSFVRPVSVKKIRKNNLKIVVREGKKHEVRVLIKKAGLKTKELTRIRIGGLKLGSLPIGTWKNMSKREREAIFEQ